MILPDFKPEGMSDERQQHVTDEIACILFDENGSRETGQAACLVDCLAELLGIIPPGTAPTYRMGKFKQEEESA